ncbi:MAG: tetratricopeptide repeat protein [bacterium]
MKRIWDLGFRNLGLLLFIISLNIFAQNLPYEFYKNGLFNLTQGYLRDTQEEDGLFLKAESLFFLCSYKTAYKNYLILKEISLDEERLSTVYYRIADCLWFIDKKEEAISSYQEALSRYPNNPSSSYAIFRIIQYYLEIKDYDRAVSLFSSYLIDYPNLPWKDSVFYSIAVSFEEIKDYNRVISYYKKILETSKDDLLRRNSLSSLARIYYENGDFEKSLFYANCLVKSYPSDSSFILLFSCLFNMKRFEDAVSVFPKISSPTKELYLAQAESLYSLGRFNEAVDFYKKGGAKTGISFSYLKLSKIDLALEELKKIGDDRSLYLIAQIGEDNEKIKAYEKIIADYPKSSFREEAFLRLSLLYLKIGSITECLVMCDEMIKEYPKTPLSLTCLYNVGISLDNEEYLWRIVSLYPNFSKNPEILYKIGDNRMKKGQYKEAIDAFSSLIEKYPKSELFGYSLYNTAFLYNKIGNPKKARLVYKTIPAIDKELGERALFYSANISFNLKDYGLAISDYQSLIKQYPKSSFVSASIYQIGWCYYKKERFDDARKYFTKIILNYKESPYFSCSIYWLAWTYFEEGRYDEAIEAYLRLQREFPEDSLSKDAYLRIGLCFYNQGEYKEAISSYQKLVEKGADKALMEEALYQIGEAFIKDNKPGAAINYYNLFLEKGQEKEMAKKIRKRIAQIYYLEGKKKDSREEYKKLLSEDLTDDEKADAYYWIGRTYLPDAKEEAIVYFRKVAELYQSSEWAADSLFRIGVILYSSGDYEDAYFEFKRLIKNYPKRDDLIKEAKAYITKIEKR